MAWYKTGTLSIAANSKKATGHGTRWADNKQGIGPGQMLLLPGTGSVALYEIASVVSDTELLLVSGPPKVRIRMRSIIDSHLRSITFSHRNRSPGNLTFLSF
ncbi:hypothetical protein AAH678_10085 [Sodalis endosymbiont of Spalangia cameroni]|uniref:hypothetical protein n=1 Tax=Sodalis praecaptivus TaxID=1239307 RepID=UPI0031F9D2BC